MNLDALQDIAERTVKTALKAGASEVQIGAFFSDEALTRFANSQVHQNVSGSEVGAAIKVVVRKQIGNLRIRSLAPRRLMDAVKFAVKAAKSAPPDENFKGLPIQSKASRVMHAFNSATANCSPEHRAEVVKKVIERAHSKSSLVKAVAGSFSTGSTGYAVANSNGVSVSTRVSLVQLAVTVISESSGTEGFGYSHSYAREIKDVQIEPTAESAAETSTRSVKPISIEVGDYEVILSSHAVALATAFTSQIGFTANSYQDEISFVRYNLGKRVFDPKLRVIDDSHDPRSLLTLAYDGEGVPKRKLELVTNGVVDESGVCYDSYTAGKAGKKSTGHAPPPVVEGVFPGPFFLNLIVEPGDASLYDMIRKTKRGLLVNRFHYVRTVDPAKVVITGLTRDGTFLIEDGEIKSAVKNLRFTESLLEAFSSVDMIGKDLVRSEGATAPAMKLPKFRFTGVTEY